MEEWSAAARAQWLAELMGALDQARRLIHEVDQAGRAGDQYAELSARIEAARFEARSLQLRNQRRADREVDPKWTGKPSARRESSEDG